jgi:hypothetical protein
MIVHLESLRRQIIAGIVVVLPHSHDIRCDATIDHRFAPSDLTMPQYLTSTSRSNRTKKRMRSTYGNRTHGDALHVKPDNGRPDCDESEAQQSHQHHHIGTIDEHHCTTVSAPSHGSTTHHIASHHSTSTSQHTKSISTITARALTRHDSSERLRGTLGVERAAGVHTRGRRCEVSDAQLCVRLALDRRAVPHPLVRRCRQRRRLRREHERLTETDLLRHGVYEKLRLERPLADDHRTRLRLSEEGMRANVRVREQARTNTTTTHTTATAPYTMKDDNDTIDRTPRIATAGQRS